MIVCGKPSDPIPGELRRDWLQEMFPAAQVLLIDDRYDENDSRVWAENTIRWLGCAPDAVFTSEAYGDPYAEHLGCEHVCVDRTRATVPCSATQIRRDPYAWWSFIDAPVRGWYAKRVCVLGAESTGTTTLAAALAESYRTSWVAEFGRDYSACKQARGDEVWRSGEFVEIAAEQCRREEAAAREADRVLICDTNALATCVWHRRYVGGDQAEVRRLAGVRPPDLYLLTGDEIPFIQDGFRDGEHIRHEMQTWFRDELAVQSVPWLEVTGDHRRRLATAEAAIDALFAESAWKPRRVAGLT